jgi:hypothetical protein
MVKEQRSTATMPPNRLLTSWMTTKGRPRALWRYRYAAPVRPDGRERFAQASI